ncbi:MAG: FISUMP domain-containing protein, partial [Dysgonomonas sp.]
GQKIGLNLDEPNNPAQTKVQGVCPNGWHLPSDYEWTQLENEIITNTAKYAHVSKNIIDDGGSLVPPSTSGGNYRGKHAPAMTNACEIYQGNVKGTSKSIAEGGFGAYFAGEIVNAAPNDFGETATYWSSSLYSINQAYYRVMSTGIGDAGVAAFTNSQTNYMSVRCKKG